MTVTVAFVIDNDVDNDVGILPSPKWGRGRSARYATLLIASNIFEFRKRGSWRSGADKTVRMTKRKTRT